MLADLGGAVYMFGTTAPFTKCIFIANSASMNNADMTISNSLWCNCADNSGGAVYVFAGAASFASCSFSANTAVNGKTSSLLDCCALAHWCALTAFGGAVVISASTASFTDCIWSSNTASSCTART